MKRIALAAFLLSTTYLIGLSFTTHPLRASFVKVAEERPDILTLPPSKLESTIRFEDMPLLSGFKTRLQGVQHDPQYFNPVGIMQWIGAAYDEKVINRKTWLPESPARLIENLELRGLRGSCYNDAILFSTFAQAAGRKVRYVSFNSSDGLGGRGHTMAEVWMEEYGKWVLFDQQQVAIFLDAEKSVPMSAYEVRLRVLTQSKEQFNHGVQIMQGRGFRVPKQNIWGLYQSSNEMHIFGSADYFTRIQRHTANRIADWLEASFEPYGKAILIGRLFRSLFGEMPRLRIVDEYSPPLHYASWYYAFRICVVLWLVSILVIVSIYIKNQEPGQKGTTVRALDLRPHVADSGQRQMGAPDSDVDHSVIVAHPSHRLPTTSKSAHYEPLDS